MPFSALIGLLSLKMKALWTFKMLWTTCPMTQHLILEDLNLQQHHHCQNLKSCADLYFHLTIEEGPVSVKKCNVFITKWDNRLSLSVTPNMWHFNNSVTFLHPFGVIRPSSHILAPQWWCYFHLATNSCSATEPFTSISLNSHSASCLKQQE